MAVSEELLALARVIFPMAFASPQVDAAAMYNSMASAEWVCSDCQSHINGPRFECTSAACTLCCECFAGHMAAHPEHGDFRCHLLPGGADDGTRRDLGAQRAWLSMAWLQNQQQG